MVFGRALERLAGVITGVMLLADSSLEMADIKAWAIVITVFCKEETACYNVTIVIF